MNNRFVTRGDYRIVSAAPAVSDVCLAAYAGLLCTVFVPETKRMDLDDAGALTVQCPAISLSVHACACVSICLLLGLR